MSSLKLRRSLGRPPATNDTPSWFGMVLRWLKPPIRAAGGPRNVQDYRFSAFGVWGNERVLVCTRAHSIRPDTTPPGEPPKQTALTSPLPQWFTTSPQPCYRLYKFEIRLFVAHLKSGILKLLTHFTFRTHSVTAASAQRYGPQGRRQGDPYHQHLTRSKSLTRHQL